MNTYRIFQMNLSESLRREVNRLGHEEAAKQYPEYNAYLNVMWSGGSKKFDASMHEFYRQVGTIGADDLNEVFNIGNGYPNSDDSWANWTERHHSLSVGDIIETDGKWIMVDPCGFGQIAPPPPPNAHCQWCGKEMAPSNRRVCSEACLDEWNLRAV